MSIIANIQWDFVPGSTGTLIEYRPVGNSTWIRPSSPNNPTLSNTYPITIEAGVSYDIRLTGYGTRCNPKSRTFRIVPSGNCCPAGYTLSEDGTYCYQINTTPATPPVSSENAVAKAHPFYSMCGSWIFNSFNVNGTGVATQIPIINTFWRNGAGNCTSGTTGAGPMNRCAVWSVTETDNQQIGFSVCVTVATTKTYYMAVGSDDWSTIRIDGNTIVDQDNVAIGAQFGPSYSALSMWCIYPVQIVAGTHVIELVGNNGPGGGGNPGAIGAEIYDNTPEEIIAATSYGDLNLIFSTKDYVGQPIQIGTGGIGYTCPDGYSLILCDGPAYCTQTLTALPFICSTTTTTTTSTTTSTTSSTTTTTTTP